MNKYSNEKYDNEIDNRDKDDRENIGSNNKSNYNNFSIVDNKQDVILSVDKTDKSYFLSMKLSNLTNSKIDLEQLLSFKIYNLMEQLNPEVIEQIVILNHSNSDNDSMDILFIFKPIGCEIGLKQKYMTMRTKREQHSNIICFKSLDFDLNADEIIEYGLQKMDKMTCHYADLYIKIYNNDLNNNIDECDIKYCFKITQTEILPKYMEHLIGLMMKKIFINLKNFILQIG